VREAAHEIAKMENEEIKKDVQYNWV